MPPDWAFSNNSSTCSLAPGSHQSKTMDPLHRLTRRLSKLSSAGTSANGQYKHDSGSGSGDAIHAAATVQDVM